MKQQKLLAAILCAATPLAYASNSDTMNEVVVTATRIEQPLSQSLLHTTLISQKEIQASQAVDLASLLKNLAGVEIYQSGGIGKQSSLFMRGTNSSHTLILLDGVRIGSATTGATAFDQLMLDQIERIEVVRGNASSLYGSEAIGGVIQIFTRRGRGAPSFNASGSAGTHSTQRAAAGLGGEVAHTSFNVQASRYKTDGVSAVRPDIVATVNPDKDGYDNTSLSGNVRHAFDADNSLSVSLFRSHGDVQYDNAFAAATAINTNTSTLGKFAVVSENRFGKFWQSKLQFSRGTDDYKNYLNGALSSSIKTENRQISWQNTLAVNSNGSLLLGLENLDQQVSGNTAYTKTGRKVDSLFAGYTGDYGLHQVQANIRQDHNSDFGTANTGLLGYGYAINQAWRITASASTSFKAPTFNNLYGPVGWGSNPNLRPERSRNKEIGLHYATGTQRFDAIYFDNRIRNLIAADNTWTKNLDQARIDGLELNYAGQFGDTGVKAALTLQDPRDTQTGLALLRRATSYGNVGLTQKLGAWQLGGEWQYSGAREDNHITAWPTQRVVMPAYDILNFTASYALDKQLKLSLRADNLFEKDYMLAHGYNTLGRTLSVGVNYQP